MLKMATCNPKICISTTDNLISVPSTLYMHRRASPTFHLFGLPILLYFFSALYPFFSSLLLIFGIILMACVLVSFFNIRPHRTTIYCPFALGLLHEFLLSETKKNVFLVFCSPFLDKTKRPVYFLIQMPLLRSISTQFPFAR